MIARRRRTVKIYLSILFIYIFYRFLSGENSDSEFEDGIEERAEGVPRYYNWSNVKEHYPVRSFESLPTARTSIPQIQAARFEVQDESARRTQIERLAAVKSNFTHAWKGYRDYAWLKDEVAPLSKGFHNTFGGWGATLVDALGTLWIMEMCDEFDEAIRALHQIDFSTCSLNELNVFETNIRYLGGLLSAYDLSGGKYPQLLTKAIELAEILHHAFDTPNRMPITRWNMRAAAQGKKQVASKSVLVAEIGSLSLEFTRLSQLTGDAKYYDAIQRVMDVFEKSQQKSSVPGLWPVIVNAYKMDFSANDGRAYTIGGMADSTYEYLPKQHLLLGGATLQYKSMYERALAPIKKHILFRPSTPKNLDILLPGKFKVFGRLNKLDEYPTEAEGQHLSCYAGGMIGLGSRLFDQPEDMDIARRLVEGCLWAYEDSANGIMPEVFRTISCPNQEPCVWDSEGWHEKLLQLYPTYEDAASLLNDKKLTPGMTKIDDARYILRPEAIESVFYLYRLTGDSTLQDRAWTMFENIVKATKTEIAHAALEDCTALSPQKMDSMESFWLAETLRYFYLVFSDPDVVSLDEWVFNTEAHPLRHPGTRRKDYGSIPNNK